MSYTDLFLVALMLWLVLIIADGIRAVWQRRNPSDIPRQEAHDLRNALNELSMRVIALEMKQSHGGSKDERP